MVLQDSVDIIELISILLRRIWVIVAGMVIFGALAFVYFYWVVAPSYTASTLMYVNNTNRQTLSEDLNVNDLAASQKLVNTYIVILQNETLMNSVLEVCGLSSTTSVTQLSRMVSMKAVNNTEVLNISVTSNDPQLSADIANAFSAVAPAEIIRVVKAGSVEVISPATPPIRPSGPNVRLNTFIGLLIGGILCSLAILAFELLDNTIKGQDDLEKHYSIPVLGEIPDFAAAAGTKGGYKKYGS
jgi:capsular polysaccharide biosynthesis protein